jgi:DNA-binding transcriptional regulator YdaS (Cro superfamily)
MDKTNTTALQRAVKLVGAPAIARSCGISRQSVYKWLRKGYPPVERCEAVEQATGGRITRFDLLPPTFSRAVS